MPLKTLIFLGIGTILFAYATFITWKAIVKGDQTRSYFKQIFWLTIAILILCVVYILTKTLPESRYYLVLQAFMTVGTGVVIVLALWGTRIQQIFNPPNLVLESIDTPGDIAGVSPENPTALGNYFHLNVVNRNPTLPTAACTVVLKQIRLLTLATKEEIKCRALTAPYSLSWPLTYRDDRDRKKYKNFSHEAVIDFVRFNMQKKKVFPVIVDYFREFDSFFGPSPYILECTLQIESNNFKSPKPQIFQVIWDGDWTMTADQIAEKVRIEEIVK